MKPRYLLLFIVNLLAFNQGLLIEETTKFRISLAYDHSDLIEMEYGISNLMRKYQLMGKTLLDIMGVVLFGYLAHSFGRKKSIISLGITSLLFQIVHLIILTEDFKKYVNYSKHPYYYYDITCQLVNSASLVISMIYIGETAEDCNRGVFVSSYILSNRLGQLILSAAKFSKVLNYLGPANILLCVVFVAAAFWLPETPLYLLINKRTDDAKKALSRLQGNSNIDEGELQDLIVSVEKSNSSNRRIMSFITNPATRKALIIGTVTFLVNRVLHTQLILQGYFVLELDLIESNYGAMVAYNNLPAFLAGPFLEICGVILTVLLVDRCGRKFLLLVSCAGGAFIFVFLDIFAICNAFPPEEHWKENYFPWLLLTNPALLLVIYNIGCATVPHILLSELFQTHGRVSGITFCYLLYCLLTYLLHTIYPLLAMSPHSDITSFSLSFTVLFGGFLFTYHCIFETKGKSLQDIVESFKKQG